MIREAIQKIINHENLTFTESQSVIDELMTGKTSEIETASLLTALAAKHETIDEIAGAAQSMRNHALTFPEVNDVLEIVDTGGDHANTFNISTTSSILLAAAGFKVAKHGNRAASSKSGAADVLEALGVDINQSPTDSYNSLVTTNLCFLFAQEYHESMKYVAPVRKALGISTIFNILGPLTNPAKPTNQLLGVADIRLMRPLAQVLVKLGVTHVTVVHGADGLDEVSPTGTTYVIEATKNSINEYTVSPTDFGLPIANKIDLVGGTPTENAKITQDILSGLKGPKREAVIMNAGMAIHTARPEVSIMEGIKIATEAIDDGRSLTKLNQLRKLNNKDVVA